MQPILRYSLVSVSGVIAGALLSFFSLKYVSPDSEILTKGKWHALKDTAAVGGGIWNRAWINLHGPMALSQKEAVYFGRERDEGGETFREECTYRVRGPKPDSAWWSVTIYDEEGFLPEKSSQYSLNSLMDSGDQLEFEIGKGLGLDTMTAGNFSLIFRLYQPGDLARFNPPVVERLKCEE